MPAHAPTDKHATHRRIIARLRQQAEDVQRIVSGLNEEQLAKRTVPDKWSLKELVCHLWRTQQVFDGRVNAMLGQDNPAITPYEPEGDTEFDRLVARPAADSLAGFLADRERLAARLDGLGPEQWHRAGRHPEFSHYDVHFQVEYMAHHEAHHIYQMFQQRVPLGKMPH